MQIGLRLVHNLLDLLHEDLGLEAIAIGGVGHEMGLATGVGLGGRGIVVLQMLLVHMV